MNTIYEQFLYQMSGNIDSEVFSIEPFPQSKILKNLSLNSFNLIVLTNLQVLNNQNSQIELIYNMVAFS